MGGAFVVLLKLGPFGAARPPYLQMDSFCVAGVTKLEEGAVTLGTVVKIDPQRGLLVQLPFGGVGAVAVTDLADAYRSNPFDGYRENQIIRSVSRQSVIAHLPDISFAVIEVYISKISSLPQVFPSSE